MYKRILRKRILKGTVIALALFAVIPVTSAAARPLTDDLNTRPVGLHQTPIGPTVAKRNGTSVRGAGINRTYQIGQYAQTGRSDTDRNYDGVGVGLVAALLLGTAGVLVARNRRHGTLAH
ncbi:MAG TPA: hypothetical protein VLU96_08485 [Gaiellaceae bacterium]|nr:hypothetical protein [Gaiellaceae bacterium]